MPLLLTDSFSRLLSDDKKIQVDVSLPDYTVCAACHCPADEIIIKRSTYYNNAMILVEYRCHHCRENS